MKKSSDPINQFRGSFNPTRVQKFMIKHIILKMYEGISHIDFIAANTSSSANTVYSLQLGRTKSGPKVYFGIYEFMYENIAKDLDLNMNNTPEDLLEDAFSHLNMRLEKTSVGVGKNVVQKFKVIDYDKHEN